MSNPVWLGTTARREGEDYVLDGYKWFTLSGRSKCGAVLAVSGFSNETKRRLHKVNPFILNQLRLLPQLAQALHMSDTG